MPDPSSPTPYYATPKQPRLLWNDRDKRRAAEPLPTQTVEIIRPFYSEITADKQGQSHTQGGLDMAHEAVPDSRLIWTNDNLVALTSLLHGDGHHAPLEGKVDLIYIDPPFAVQSDFKINVEIENGLSDEKLPTLIEEIAYKDTWKDGLDSYLSMMRDRLELLKRLLAPTGSIYVHCDWHAGHYLKVLMDEMFGYENFMNQITWKRTSAHSDAKQGARQLGRQHDYILWYKVGEIYKFNTAFTKYDEDYVKTSYNYVDTDGRRYKSTDLTAAKAGGDTSYEWKGKRPASGRYWAYSKQNMEEFDRKNLLHYSGTGLPRLKQYLDEMPGVMMQDLWIDIPPVQAQGIERIGYPTQKPLALLQRIIAASSNPGDLVLDCFSGSGTTAVAAETMKDTEGKAAPAGGSPLITASSPSTSPGSGSLKPTPARSRWRMSASMPGRANGRTSTPKVPPPSSTATQWSKSTAAHPLRASLTCMGAKGTAGCMSAR